MSRQNKVNPGKYTQAGRLSPDDAAREMRKQREAASPRNTHGGQFGEPRKPRVKEKQEDKRDEDDEESKQE